VEHCDNLIFHRRAAVDELTQLLLDMNRLIGQPKKIATIFGRKLTKEYKGKLQTVIEDLDLPNPVIRSHYGSGFVKQYVPDDRLLRTETATNSVYDYGVNKDVENLPQLQDRMSAIIDSYHNAQEDILESFIDRGQLRKLPSRRSCPMEKDSRTQTLSPARGPGTRCQYRRRQQLQYGGVVWPSLGCSGPGPIGVLASIIPLRPLQVARQRARRKNPAFPSLPTGRPGYSINVSATTRMRFCT
jgi:hypothetical protein